MKQQRNMFQAKQQDKMPEEELSGDSSLLDKVFKIVVIKMIKELRRRMDEQNENLEVFSKELANMKKIRGEEYNN